MVRVNYLLYSESNVFEVEILLYKFLSLFLSIYQWQIFFIPIELQIIGMLTRECE